MVRVRSCPAPATVAVVTVRFSLTLESIIEPSVVVAVVTYRACPPVWSYWIVPAPPAVMLATVTPAAALLSISIFPMPVESALIRMTPDSSSSVAPPIPVAAFRSTSPAVMSGVPAPPLIPAAAVRTTSPRVFASTETAVISPVVVVIVISFTSASVVETTLVATTAPSASRVKLPLLTVKLLTVTPFASLIVTFPVPVVEPVSVTVFVSISFIAPAAVSCTVPLAAVMSVVVSTAESSIAPDVLTTSTATPAFVDTSCPRVTSPTPFMSIMPPPVFKTVSVARVINPTPAAPPFTTMSPPAVVTSPPAPKVTSFLEEVRVTVPVPAFIVSFITRLSLSLKPESPAVRPIVPVPEAVTPLCNATTVSVPSVVAIAMLLFELLWVAWLISSASPTATSVT